jgi:predicted DNA-binding antitoxin AbrB/MazE fold protein
MTSQHVTAIFQKGVLKPLKPLNLAENERVELQVIRQTNGERPILVLSGIWQGLGDLSYEGITTLAPSTP